MKLILALTFVLACFGAGLAQSGAPKAVATTKQEKKDLFELIAKNDKEVGEAISDNGDREALAKVMDVKKINLSQDKPAAYFVTLADDRLCGALANCPQWVYRKTGNEYQLLLRTFGRELTPEKTATNKLYDLRSEGGDTALQGSFTNYQFDGTRYQAKSCFTRIYATKRKKEKIVPVKCEEDQ